VSVAVSIEALQEKVAEFGPTAYLLTVGEGGRAHVVSVRAEVSAATVRVSAGRTSRANTRENPAATLLWPAPAGGLYSLIVDGDVDPHVDTEGELVIRPTRAVLHRVADASADLPNCITVD
jgi:hypothetical protein